MSDADPLGLGELLDQLLRDMRIADRGIGFDDRAAALFALEALGFFVVRLANLERQHVNVVGPTPGEALLRLARAVKSLDEGAAVDSMLAPASDKRIRGTDGRGLRQTLPANVLAGRATVAAAIDLFMLGGRTLKDAAREVAGLLRGKPILANRVGSPSNMVARWREEIMRENEKREMPDVGSDASPRIQAAAQFNSLIAEAKRMVGVDGLPSDFIKVAKFKLKYGPGMVP